LLFIEEFIEAEMISQISSSEIFHGHIKILSILEGRFHVNNEGIIDLFEDSLLIDD
jgi:hypothetical protein